jgi:cytochrome c biogenesis protein CcmG, thiol:disulfide interchange protein DsbE
MSRLAARGSRLAFVGAGPIALAMLLGLGCSMPERAAEVGKAAPAYEAATLDGDRVTLASLKGEVVMLNVWATWCRPCVREMPSLQALHDELQPHGFRVVAVSVDRPGAGGQIRDFLVDHGISFDILHDPGKDIARRFQTIGLPETFLIDRDGVVRHHWIGMIDTRTPRVRDPVMAALRGDPVTTAGR